MKEGRDKWVLKKLNDWVKKTDEEPLNRPFYKEIGLKGGKKFVGSSRKAKKVKVDNQLLVLQDLAIIKKIWR
jgi:hypothetical protein